MPRPSTPATYWYTIVRNGPESFSVALWTNRTANAPAPFQTRERWRDQAEAKRGAWEFGIDNGFTAICLSPSRAPRAAWYIRERDERYMADGLTQRRHHALPQLFYATAGTAPSLPVPPIESTGEEG